MSSAAFAACGKHSGEGERCSGRDRKVFGFVTGMAFTFASESRSPSDRNAVRLPTGIAFGIDRIHHTDVPKFSNNLRRDAKLIAVPVEMAQGIARYAHQGMCPLDRANQDIRIDEYAHL